MVTIVFEITRHNLEKMHSIQATDTSDRTFFHISILNKSYKEVLEIIEGKEDTLFNLESVIA
jgi:hypothetical protein